MSLLSSLAMDAIAVIPARLGSTRLPRKVLAPIAGRPMLAWVYEGARRSPLLRDVIVATDSQEIMDVCHRSGWKAQLTSTDCRNGTERVQEVSRSIAAEVYVTVQGDEPLVRAEHIHELLRVMQDPEVQVGTLKTPIPAQSKDVDNPNAVKVVADSAGRALYFSRATIPHDRDRVGSVRYFKHLGLYAYRKPALDRFVELGESGLERAERLEQLRFLENGIAIYVGETPFDTVGVDTEADRARVEAMLTPDVER
jgi:3-deoxy-manno-octulosonate cytidylyltransferase (CMP-KDO synthetase)